MASTYLNTNLVGPKQLWNQTSAAIYRGRVRRRAAGMSGNLPRVCTSSSSRCRYGLSVPNVDGRPISTVVPMSTMGSSVFRDIYYDGSYNSIYSYVDDLAYRLNQIDSDSHLLWLKEHPPTLSIFRPEQWSLLQRYCSPTLSVDTIVDIKVALDNELVLMCVWYLFNDVPNTHTKEDVAWALKNIFEAATNMHIDEESVTPTKISIDQDYVDGLLVDLVCSKNEEVLRQVCYSLGFLHECRSHYKFTLGNGIQNKLIQLSREFSCDSPMLTNVLFAINRIAMVNKGMREKVIEAEFSDGFLRKLLTREGGRESYLEAEAYFMVCNFACGQCNDETWKYLKEHLMRLVLDRCVVCHSYVERAGVLAIWMFIAKASPRCIKELLDTGCSKNLIHLVSDNDEFVNRRGIEAVETILSLGDDNPNKEYGKIIDDLTKDWESFLVSYPHSFDTELVNKASGIVRRYRPDKHLEWLQDQDCMYTC